MRALVDIVHPADVLFFKRPIERLMARGDTVMILSREKDVANALLDQFGFAYETVSQAGRGLVGLARELAARDLAVWRKARRFRPDVLTGFGGVAAAHVGAATRAPSCVFYDSENATLQTRITWPFVTRLTVPEAYDGPTPKERTVRAPGVKELSYFHPDGFKPDAAIARSHGWAPERDLFLVRMVDWRANHDGGKSGPGGAWRGVVETLRRHGDVVISSEAALPDDLEHYAFRGPPGDLHHLMAHARLLVGESATMASECAILGAPAIYAGHDFPCHVRELAQAGLVKNVTPRDWEKLPLIVDAALARPRGEAAMARAEYLASRPDWAALIVDQLDATAKAS